MINLAWGFYTKADIKYFIIHIYFLEERAHEGKST